MIDFQLSTILTFAAGVTAVLGVYSLMSDIFLRDRLRVSDRVDQEFLKHQREKVQKSSLFKDHFSGLVTEAAAENEDLPNLFQQFEIMVEQSGMRLDANRLLTIAGITGVLIGGAVGLMRQSVLIGGAVGLVAATIPILYVRYRRNARVERLIRQLPDAFDLMARVIRAGQTISQAQQAVADEFDQPLAGEFAQCYEQQNLGLPPEVALRDLARRTGLLEMKIFVMALLVQQQSGGNLAEMLDKLAHVVRERFRIRGKIRALTAEGRAQAVLLLVLPIVLMLIMMALSPMYAEALAQVPNMIVAMLVAEFIGALWIRKIVNFDF